MYLPTMFEEDSSQYVFFFKFIQWHPEIGNSICERKLLKLPTIYQI